MLVGWFGTTDDTRIAPLLALPMARHRHLPVLLVAPA